MHMHMHMCMHMFWLAGPHWPCSHHAGDIYSGEWKAGKKHGEGTYSNPNP
jgi:hypothetical protein